MADLLKSKFRLGMESKTGFSESPFKSLIKRGNFSRSTKQGLWLFQQYGIDKHVTIRALGTDNNRTLLIKGEGSEGVPTTQFAGHALVKRIFRLTLGVRNGNGNVGRPVFLGWPMDA